MNTKETEWDVVEGSILPISSQPSVKMEGHDSVNCDSELQLLIAVSEDDPEPAPESNMAPKEYHLFGFPLQESHDLGHWAVLFWLGFISFLLSPLSALSLRWRAGEGLEKNLRPV